MKNKKLMIILGIALLISFLVGYLLGEFTNRDVIIEKDKTVYKILEEGIIRIK